MATQNPGDAEVRYCPRSYDQPILVLDGRRCIYGWWPPSAVCEACGIGRDETGGGYVGPVIGWTVTDVDLDRDAPVVTGRFWAITFEPTVPRW